MNKIKEILQRSKTALDMLDAYGGDNLPTKMARADELTKIKICNYILKEHRKDKKDDLKKQNELRWEHHKHFFDRSR
jgi:hypothetical protein